MNNTRFTVTLPDERYAALKETAARQGKTMAEIINAGLELYGVKSRPNALRLLEQARRRAATLSDDEAMRLAVKEVRT
ncbi:MAG: ribbon-helix-helix protein, CopG family, partial [Nevskiales bacterium]